MISSSVIPEAKYTNTSETVIRMPLMQGSPFVFPRFNGDDLSIVDSQYRSCNNDNTSGNSSHEIWPCS